jgi:GNAT superfamily N-acetyltransferase
LALSHPELLSVAHDLSKFTCGKPTLDHWLKTRALSNQQKGFTAVVVVHEQGRVVGYYGLAPTAVVAGVLPRAIRTGQPPDPVPCLLLGQLATDVGWAGQGIGSGLVKHALERCVTAATLIGGRAMMVNAVDAEAARFWRRRGFVRSKDDPLTLFRSSPTSPPRWRRRATGEKGQSDLSAAPSFKVPRKTTLTPFLPPKLRLGEP